jgi:hypothetical protein
MSRVWDTGREPFGLMPVSAAKVATSSAMSNHVSQVTPVLSSTSLAVRLDVEEKIRDMIRDAVLVAAFEL